MSPHSFVLVLVGASAVLAFWLGARFPGLGPTSFSFGVLHLLCGFAAVRAISGLTNAAVAFSPTWRASLLRSGSRCLSSLMRSSPASG